VSADSKARSALAGSERETPPGAVNCGPPDMNERTTVTIVVRPKTSSHVKATELAALPPGQRTYVSRADFASTYGADPADVAAVERFALAAGAIVLEANLARRSVVLEGTLATFVAAFEAKLSIYRSGGVQYRGRTGVLTVPSDLSGVIVGIFGLDERPQARAHFRRRLRPAAKPATSFTPPQVAQAYAFPAGDGTGQTIALIELGGGFAQSDLDTYFSGLKIATPKVSSVEVDGATNAPTGDPNSADAEVLLDIEVAGSIAPAANIVVYFAPNTDQGFLDAVTTAIHDTQNKPQIVSISWGGPESSWTTQSFTNFDAAFTDAGTLGVTVLIAAGDGGSSDGVSDGSAHVDFPASSPHVVACGGTTLSASGATIKSEVVWNDGASGGATGGGVSDAFALPAWQQNANVPPSANAGGRVGRGVPDVAGDADPNTGYDTYVDGTSGVIGGTSAVAPLWAALVARLNQHAAQPLGFVNAALYSAAASFNDITSGNNGAYSAARGWDACTGLGSPNGTKLAAALASTSAPAPAPKPKPKPPAPKPVKKKS
jgi:kumamolisin